MSVVFYVLYWLNTILHTLEIHQSRIVCEDSQWPEDGLIMLPSKINVKPCGK
jgi:hypothetical protein